MEKCNFTTIVFTAWKKAACYPDYRGAKKLWRPIVLLAACIILFWNLFCTTGTEQYFTNTWLLKSGGHAIDYTSLQFPKKKFFRSLEIQSSYKNLIKIKNILCRAIISVSFLKMDFEVPKNYIIFFFCVGNSDWIVFSCHKLAIFFHKVGACHNSQRGVAKKQRYLSHTDDTVWICLALSKAS